MLLTSVKNMICQRRGGLKMKAVVIIIGAIFSAGILWYTSQPYKYNYVKRVEVYCGANSVAEVTYVQGNIETVKVSGCPQPYDVYCSIKIKQDFQRILLILLPLILSVFLLFTF